MGGEEFVARYWQVVGLLDAGKMVTVIPLLGGGLDWREYQLKPRTIEALFSWPDEERAKVYSELLAKRGAEIGV